MVVLLKTVLNKALNNSKDFEKITSLSKKGKNLRNEVLADLYKLTGLKEYDGISGLESELLRVTCQSLGINESTNLLKRSEIIDIIYDKYQKLTVIKLNKMKIKEKKEFIEEYQQKLKEQGVSFLLDDDEMFNSFLSDESENIAFSGSAAGIGVSLAVLGKIKPAPFLALGALIANGLGRLAIPRLIFLGVGGAFLGTLLGGVAVFQGYSYFKGKKAKKISIVTLSLILKHKEYQEEYNKSRYLNYLKNLMIEGEEIDQELRLLSMEGATIG